jgi:hypothetical protein
MLPVTLVAPRILIWFIDFCEVCVTVVCRLVIWYGDNVFGLYITVYHFPLRYLTYVSVLVFIVKTQLVQFLVFLLYI